MVTAGLRNLVVTGTCFEYGMQSGSLSEDSAALPSNPYGFAKDTLRRQLQFLQATAPFNLTWARLFYSYGEGQAATSLLPALRQAVERGDAAFNMSGGEQLRDFLPVETLAADLVSLAALQRDCGVVNLCSGEPIAVRRLVESWIRQNGWNIALNLGHYPYPTYEPLAFWGDRTKLTRLLQSVQPGSAADVHTR
jgi:dTDP-6-deoxy-L-talose 4-dehydrogenase (NAD+)